MQLGSTERLLCPIPRRSIKRWCCLTSVCLSLTSVAYIGPKSRTERPSKTKIGTKVARVTRDSDTTFKVKITGGGAYCGGLPRMAGLECCYIVIWAYAYLSQLLVGWLFSARAHQSTATAILRNAHPPSPRHSMIITMPNHYKKLSYCWQTARRTCAICSGWTPLPICDTMTNLVVERQMMQI